MYPINVLSLFDGISCGQLALRRANIPVSLYFASEIEPNAIKVTQHNFPNTIQLGDVTQIDFKDFIGGIDLLIGGSPCQDLSIAKTERKGLEGERSSLFFYYVKALHTIKPKYFLFENNYNMPKAAKEIITNLLGVEPIFIDSAIVSAQSRKRLYWTNIPTTPIQDKGIKLQDILEYGYADREKSLCLLRSYARFKATPSYMCHRYFDKSSGQAVFESQRARDELLSMWKGNRKSRDELWNVWNRDERNRDERNRDERNRDEWENNQEIDEKNGKIRPMTCIECERLQTLPDGYTDIIKAETKRKEMIGNAWTVDVIAEILKGMR